MKGYSCLLRNAFVLHVFFFATPFVASSETVGSKDIQSAENYKNDFPVKVEKTAKAVLGSCSLDAQSRYKSVVKSLGTGYQLSEHASPLACSGLKKVDSNLKATQDLLTELRKIREKEIYEVEALNELMYDPDHFFANDANIESQLKTMLCERSTLALSQVTKDQSVLKLNQCSDPKSDIAKMISAAAKSAVSKFKSQGMRKPSASDLSALNAHLKSLKSACDQIGAGIKTLSAGQKISITQIDTKSLSSDELAQKESQKKISALSIDAKKKNPDQGKLIETKYKAEVYPIVVKIFSSPYGRVLSNSTYLQGKIGLNMDADWNKPQFCYSLNNSISLTKGEINTGYFGSPANKILGSRANVRQNMSELMMTRFPKLREKFWDQLAESAVLQSPIAQAQQQVAYELLYNAQDNDVKRLIQENPVYATLACSAIQHEAFWEKGSTKKFYQWSKNIVVYGGMGAGFAAGFFSGGSGWVLAASIASGLTSSTVGTVAHLKDNIDQNKKEIIEQIQLNGNAIVDQADVKSKSAQTVSIQDISTKSLGEQQKIKQYIEQFQELEAQRNLSYGSAISKSKDPKKLRDELLKNAKDSKEKALIELAYNYAVTASSLGIAKGLGGLAGFAKAKNLESLEKLAVATAKLESGVVSPSDIATALASCLVVKDCSGAGVVVGSASKIVHVKLGSIFAKLKKVKGNEAKTYEELLDYAAEEMARQSGLKKADLLAQLRLSVKESDLTEPLLTTTENNKSFLGKITDFFGVKSKPDVFENYDLTVPELKNFKVCEQMPKGCTLSAGSSFMKLNKLVPEGMEIDPEYLEGLRIWQRSSKLLDEISLSKKPISGAVEKIQNEVVTTGNETVDFFNTAVEFVPKLRPIPKVQTTERMASPERRYKLSQELADVFAHAHHKPRLELQKQLNSVMQKYYGPLQVSKESASLLKGASLESYSLVPDQEKLSVIKKYKSDYSDGKIVSRFPRNFHQTEEATLSEVIRRNLSEGKSLLFTLKGNDQVFDSLATGKISALDGTAENIGHKMVLVGVKTNSKNEIEELLLLNSWGKNSGQSGYVSVRWKDLVAHQKFSVDEVKFPQSKASVDNNRFAASENNDIDNSLVSATEFTAAGKKQFLEEFAAKNATESGRYITIKTDQSNAIHGKILEYKTVDGVDVVNVLDENGLTRTIKSEKINDLYVTTESKAVFSQKRELFLEALKKKETPYISYFHPEKNQPVSAKIVGYKEVDGKSQPVIMLLDGKTMILDAARSKTAFITDDSQFSLSTIANQAVMDDGTKIKQYKNINDLAQSRVSLLAEQKNQNIFAPEKSRQIILGQHDDAFVLNSGGSTKIEKMAKNFEEKHGIKMVYSQKANDELGSTAFFSQNAALRNKPLDSKMLTSIFYIKPTINTSSHAFQGKVSLSEIHEAGHAQTYLNLQKDLPDPLGISYHSRSKDGEKLVLPYADELPIYATSSQADEARQYAFNFISNTRQRPEAELRSEFQKKGKIPIKKVFGVTTKNYLDATEMATVRLKTVDLFNQRSLIMNESAKVKINSNKSLSSLSFVRKDGVSYAVVLTEKGFVDIPIQKKIVEQTLLSSNNQLVLRQDRSKQLTSYLNEMLNQSNAMLKNQKQAIDESSKYWSIIKANPDTEISYDEYLMVRKTFMKTKTSVNFKPKKSTEETIDLFDHEVDF